MKLQSIRNRIEYFLATPSGRVTAYIAGVVLVIVAGLSLLQTFHVLEKGIIPLHSQCEYSSSLSATVLSGAISVSVKRTTKVSIRLWQKINWEVL